MAVESEGEVLYKKAKKQKRNKSRVVFEEEVIRKEQATVSLTEVLSKKKDVDPSVDVKANKRKKNKVSKEVELNNTLSDTKSTKNIEKRVQEEFTEESENNEVIKAKKIKKKNKVKSENTKQEKKNRIKRKLEDVVDMEQGNEKDSTKKKMKNKESEEASDQSKADSKTPSKTEESIRAKKKRKHQQLLEEKKKKSELVTQENVLNYLSKWKHARVQWKFEKLKQIWLSENLYDSAKVPEEFWETTVEYFSESKGFIRNLILREALKIVEKQDNSEEENLEEEYQIGLKRARNIVQTLQE